MSDPVASTKPQMSLEEARAVIWPFNSINRPIGQVLDERTITIRDLAWASQSAYDLKVKVAARAILLYALHGEGVRSPLNIVIASRYSESEEHLSRLLAGVELGFGLAFLLFIGNRVIQVLQLPGMNPLVVAIAAIILAVPITVLSVYFAIALLRDASAQQIGRWGEEKVVNQLAAHLDGQWTLYRNFQWPRRGGDIDILLVGPGGTWVLEVKAWSGEVRNVEHRWERKGRWGWQRISKHPGKQAARNAARLKTYLADEGLEIRWVDKAIVWAKSENDRLEKPGTIKLVRPEIDVWRLDTFSSDIEALLTMKAHATPEWVSRANDIILGAINETRNRKV